MRTPTRNELTELLLGREVKIRFVSISEAIELNRQAAAEAGANHGVRDLVQLEAALHAPMLACLEITQNGTNDNMFALAAILAEAIASNRPFVEANNATAQLASDLFLGKNGAQ